MTLDEAIVVIRTELMQDAEHVRVQEALQALRDYLKARARHATDSTEFQQIAAEHVYDKLVDQALSGDAPHIAKPAAYLNTALRNKVCDLARRAQTQEDAREREKAERKIAAEIQAAELAIMEREEAALAVFERMSAIILRTTAAPYRGSREAANRTLKRIHVHGDTLKEALIHEDPALADNAGALTLAAEALHKAHQRLRRAIATEASAQLAAKRLTAAEAEDLHWLLTRLRRRSPNRSPSRVSTPNETKS